MEEEIKRLIGGNRALQDVAALKETIWINPKFQSYEKVKNQLPIREEQIIDAQKRLERFAPFIAQHFPDTRDLKGIIESPLREIPNMLKELQNSHEVKGKLYLKMDSHLAVAGSIKARGGIYEVLKHTEDLAIENNLISYEDDYSKLASQESREFFNQYTIQVGSTGNLGLSIGITSAAIGYKVIVHMSMDAKQWKKDLLRSKGVTIVEYNSDFSLAVKEGRKKSDEDPNSYFIDDENSVDLFLGYAVAASRLKKQLEEQSIIVDEEHPIFVYLPCGVGGAPGGVTYGLKTIFKDNVHCFFIEPTHSPCMLLGMATGLQDKVSVQDFGVDGFTEADGLAVGRPSGFVGGVMDPLLSGIFTIDDARLFHFMRNLNDKESIQIEPSACAAFMGPAFLEEYKESKKYLLDHNVNEKIKKGTHIAWATGGNLVPKETMEEYLNQ